LRFAVDGLTAFTTWPLRLLSLLGACLSFLAFLYGLVIIISHWLYGDPVQGWATLITVVLFFSGVNLMSLGVVENTSPASSPRSRRGRFICCGNARGRGLSIPTGRSHEIPGGGSRAG
jgi:hypothetical protein